MSKIIDITGIIHEDMWHYEPPFPKVEIKPLPHVPWVKGDVYCELFEGMCSQTGTYFETPAHFYGNDKSYLLIDVPLEKCVDIDCVVLNIGEKQPIVGEKRYGITVKDLEGCYNAKYLKPGDALLISTGWGSHWSQNDYLEKGPYMTYDAMMWCIDKEPSIMGGDTARWENLDKLEGFFPEFYAADILMLGPCVNLEQVSKPKVKLSVLPLKIPRTSCTPCRAILVEDN